MRNRFKNIFKTIIKAFRLLISFIAQDEVKAPQPPREPVQKLKTFVWNMKPIFSDFTTQQEPESTDQYYLGVRVRGIPPDPNKCNEHMRIHHPCFHNEWDN